MSKSGHRFHKFNGIPAFVLPQSENISATNGRVAETFCMSDWFSIEFLDLFHNSFQYFHWTKLINEQSDQNSPFLFQIFIKNDCLVKLGHKPEDKYSDPHHGHALHLPQAVAEEEGHHHHQQGSMVSYWLNYNTMFFIL
jgi:hypothetical protein